MLQPVNLQLAHYNVEHSAQISKDAIAAAQQTSQTREITQESVRRTQVVQNTEAAAEAQKVRRRNEDERERRREGQQSFSDLFDSSGSEQEEEQTPGKEQEEQKTEQAAQLAMKAQPQSLKAFDLYA